MSIFFGAVTFLLLYVQISNAENLRPIIGVVAQENHDWPGTGDTFIGSTYFRFVQQAGARAVPILTKKSHDYYEEVFKNINGVLLPGGGADPVLSGYAHAANILFRLALKANDAGDFFPIWGTCLGFEQLAVIVGGPDVLSQVQGWNLTQPLNFSVDYKKTEIFGSLTSELYEYITTQDTTQNMHHYGVLTKTFETNSKLSSFFRVLTTNTDASGQEYVSSMEGVKYPIYGVQYHPEKNIFDWDLGVVVNHHALDVAFAQNQADFLVQQARRSTHHFPSLEVESNALIDTYQPVYMARRSTHHFSNLEAESKSLIDTYQPVYMGPPTFYSIYFFNYTTTEAGEGSIEAEESQCMLRVMYDKGYLTLATLALVGVVLVTCFAHVIYTCRRHSTSKSKGAAYKRFDDTSYIVKI